MRCFMIHVAGNYPSHKKYEKTQWLCQACDGKVREDQDHLTQCPGYTDLIHGVNMDSDRDLVGFYKRVMERREKEGW